MTLTERQLERDERRRQNREAWAQRAREQEEAKARRRAERQAERERRRDQNREAHWGAQARTHT